MWLIRRHVPNDSHKLFSKNTVKVSYTGNLASHIQHLNASILQPAKPTELCNSRNKESCLLKGEFKATDLVYKATVQTTTGVSKNYIGPTTTAFKTCYTSHQSSMRHEK